MRGWGRPFTVSQEIGVTVGWGGLLRKVRTQERDTRVETAPLGDIAPPSPLPPDPASAWSALPVAVAAATDAADPATTAPARRRVWTSGAFPDDAARLFARGEETSYILRCVVEWATAATGARHAVLWALDTPDTPDTPDQPLTTLAWAATDGWQPDEIPPPRPDRSPALLRAFGTPETVIVETNQPLEQGAGWAALLGATPLALCAAIGGGKARGILAVAGLEQTAEADASFGEDARAALAACASLAAIIFERHQRPDAPATELPPLSDDADPALALPPTPLGTATTVEAGAAALAPDPFLALPPRAAMLARLEEEVGRARRFGHPLAVLVLDADRLAEWGERGGDGAAALAHLVTLARDSTRDVDLLGRGEGDELILILPVSEVDDALRVGERIRTALIGQQPADAAVGDDLRLTVSGGAVGYPDDGSSATELLAAAEHTVGYAKRMGRDQIRLRGLGDMEAPSLDTMQTAPTRGLATSEGLRIDQVFQGLLEALVAAGDAHDQARAGHGHAVGRYAHALAEACGLDPEQTRLVEMAGMLHDAGKIGLPDAILSKREPLTAEDRAVLREQPAVGRLMLQQVPALERVVPLVQHAHERYDGGGYPAGLVGNQIPFGARIIAIAEGYEAMISDRPYRRALGHTMAIAELWREAGGRYDPRLVDTFIRLIGPGEAGQGETWNPALLEQIAVDPSPWPAASAAAPERDSLALPLPDPSAAANPVADAVTATTPATAEAHPATPEVAAPLGESGPGEPPPAVAAAPLSPEAPIAQALPAPAARHDVDARLAGVTAPRPEEAVEEAIVWYDDDLQEAPARPDATTLGAGAPTQERAIVAPQPSQRLITRRGTGSLLGLPQLPEAPSPQASAEPDTDDTSHGPERLNVDDTILVLRQTTLSRIAGLDRLTNRRTGPLASATNGTEKN